MDETRIEVLTAKHDSSSFDCGKPPLNSFIRQHATVNNDRGVSRVYAAVRGTDQHVLAYYASSAGTFLRDYLPPDDQSGLPKYPLPTAHLGRLAVDLSCRGQRLGELLLFHFLKTACDVAERIGVFAVDLFSKGARLWTEARRHDTLPLDILAVRDEAKRSAKVYPAFHRRRVAVESSL